MEIEPVSGLRKSVGPGHDWIGDAGSWIGSSGTDWFASAAKSFVRKQRVSFDEGRGAIDADASRFLH